MTLRCSIWGSRPLCLSLVCFKVAVLSVGLKNVDGLLDLIVYLLSSLLSAALTRSPVTLGQIVKVLSCLGIENFAQWIVKDRWCLRPFFIETVVHNWISRVFSVFFVLTQLSLWSILLMGVSLLRLRLKHSWVSVVRWLIRIKDMKMTYRDIGAYWHLFHAWIVLRIIKLGFKSQTRGLCFIKPLMTLSQLSLCSLLML